jgi:hypothetical protein
MSARRTQCRLTCEIDRDGQVSRGIALSLSEQGVFVQTRSSLAVGTECVLRVVRGPDWPEAVVAARVSDVKKVHPSAQVVVERGMTLEVTGPTDEWKRLLLAFGCSDPVLAASPGAELPHFRVVLRSRDGIRIRTRVVRVACPDQAAARAGVEADLEPGWEIVRIECESPGGGASTALQAFRVVALSEGGRRRWEARVDARTPLEARQEAERDLPPTWRLENVERDTAGDEAAAAAAARPAPSLQPPVAPDWFQVKARRVEGNRIRTRVVRVRAADADEASRMALAQLGDDWQIETVRAR